MCSFLLKINHNISRVFYIKKPNLVNSVSVAFKPGRFCLDEAGLSWGGHTNTWSSAQSAQCGLVSSLGSSLLLSTWSESSLRRSRNVERSDSIDSWTKPQSLHNACLLHCVYLRDIHTSHLWGPMDWGKGRGFIYIFLKCGHIYKQMQKNWNETQCTVVFMYFYEQYLLLILCIQFLVKIISLYLFFLNETEKFKCRSLHKLSSLCLVLLCHDWVNQENVPSTLKSEFKMILFWSSIVLCLMISPGSTRLLVFPTCVPRLPSSSSSCYGSTVIITDPPIVGLCIYKP